MSHILFAIIGCLMSDVTFVISLVTDKGVIGGPLGESHRTLSTSTILGIEQGFYI